jgi:LPS sulfotransferase NodH
MWSACTSHGGLRPLPHTCYLICTTPRSGSTLLADLLTSSGVAGQPDEHFLREGRLSRKWGIIDFPSFYQAVLWVATSENGVFGTKVMSGMIEDLAMKLRPVVGLDRASTAEVLEAAFPNPRYIWLSRRDKVRQAISYFRAGNTGEWARVRGTPPSQNWTLAFNFQEIDSLLPLMHYRDAAWRTFFDNCGIAPHRIYYEDLVQDPTQTVLDILHYLRLSPPDCSGLVARLRRQADELSEDWERRYHHQFALGWTPA